MKVIVAVFAILGLVTPTLAIIFTRCSLAQELRNKGVPEEHIAAFTCIAEYESSFNTSAVGKGQKERGLFQFHPRYWCDRGEGGCGVKCSALTTDDITDAAKCALTVLKEHGIDAWTVYKPRCKNNLDNYLAGC